MVFALAADAALENGLLDSIGYAGALVLDLEDQLIAKVCHRQAYPAILAGMLAGCFKGIVDQVAEHADQLFPGQVGWTASSCWWPHPPQQQPAWHRNSSRV